jgi:hypothetical protein
MNRRAATLVHRQALAVTAAGLSIGLPAAVASTRFLRSQLYGVAPTDPPTFGGVLVLPLAIAFAARYVPSRRAAAVEPVAALQSE